MKIEISRSVLLLLLVAAVIVFVAREKEDVGQVPPDNSYFGAGAGSLAAAIKLDPQIAGKSCAKQVAAARNFWNAYSNNAVTIER